MGNYAVFAGETRVTKWLGSKTKAMQELAKLVHMHVQDMDGKEHRLEARADFDSIRWVPTGIGWAYPLLEKPKKHSNSAARAVADIKAKRAKKGSK